MKQEENEGMQSREKEEEEQKKCMLKIISIHPPRPGKNDE